MLEYATLEQPFYHNYFSGFPMQTGPGGVQGTGEVPEQKLRLEMPENNAAAAMTWGFSKKEPLPNFSASSHYGNQLDSAV